MAYNLSNFDKRPKMYQERNQGQRRDDHSYDYEMQQFQHFHEPAVIHEHADYVRHDKLRQPDNPSKINSEKQRQIDHLRQSNITHSDYLVSQTFENELPFYMRPRYLDSEMDRQTDYPSHKTFNKSGQHRSSRSYNQRYELKNDSHGRDLYRDTGQLVRRETERARSSLHKDEINTARESYHGMRSARAYDMLVDDFGDADIEREAKTELDEPIPDYAEDDGRLHHDVRQGDMYEIERDAPSLSQMHRNQVTKGKDNPAFTYDDWEHRRNEAEKRSQDQSEIMKPDRNRYQRERHDRHENYRRDNPSSGDESFTSEREKSQILTDRRKIRHRATIASPRDLQVSAHEAFNTIQRRKSERRMKSDLVDDRNSIFIETDNNENKLPSNRHAWTKPLNERIEALHTHRDESAHGFAGSLR